MRLDIETIPKAGEAPPSAEPSAVWVSSDVLSRRKVLGAMGGVAIASGLSVLGLLPWSRPQKAFAAAYTSWPDCHGFWDSSTTCVPSNAYYSSNNCSGIWHRNDGASGTCYNYRYTHNPTSCAGNNAWKWGGSGARGYHRMCSDGWYEYHDCGGGNISRFSICRTAIA